MTENTTWSFVVATDLHLREDNPYVVPTGLENVAAIEKFREMLRHISTLNPTPEFLMLLGDLHMEKFEPFLTKIPLPVHVVMGNHEKADDRRRLRALFQRDFQEQDFYTFKQNETLFICLCNAIPGDHVGHFESQHIQPNVGQLQWLEEQLQHGQNYQHCIVFGHVPPSPDSKPHPHHLAQNDALWLRQQVRKYRPTALFFGHRHQRIYFEEAGVPFYSLRSSNWNFDADEPIGFSVVTVNENCVEEEFVRISPSMLHR